MNMETTGRMQESARTASVPNRLPKLGDMMMFRLYRAWSAGNPIFTRLCEGRFNITRREWRLLAIAVQYDRLTSTQMTHAVGLDAPRTSRAVGALCNKGLLERSRDSVDARTVHISVTQQGLRLYQEIMPMVVSLNDVIFQDLDAGELQALGSMLDRIARRADQMMEEDLIKERPHRSRPGKALPAKGPASHDCG